MLFLVSVIFCEITIFRDSLIISLVNCGTSVFAGFVIFATVGYMAHAQGKSVEEVASEGK